jgi:hypothetical protein
VEPPCSELLICLLRRPPPPTSSTSLKFYNVKVLSMQYSDLSDTSQFFWSGIAITKLDWLLEINKEALSESDDSLWWFCVRCSWVRSKSVAEPTEVTPWSRVLLEKLIVKKYPSFYGTRTVHYCVNKSLPTTRSCEIFRNSFLLFAVENVNTRNLQAGGLPTVGCSLLLIQYIVYLHNWRSFLHQRPEDATCHGDKGPT